MVRYILEFLFCSGLFIALYKLLIEERVAHSWARVYLVAGMLLSAVIPMLELPIYPAQTLYYELPLLTFTEELPESTPAAMAEPKAPAIDWTRALSMVAWGVYLIVCGLNIARFVYRLWVIRRLRTVAKLTVYEAYTLAESERVKEPFSFWRTIFMNYMFSGREREQILIHERSHVLHRHTAERLTLELLRCVFWFNPFVWLAANALVEVQEWEADSDVLNQGYDVYEYRQLIFRQLFGYNADITCGLNSQLTKKRFLMMTNFKRGKLSFIRLSVAIPMVVAMILAFGAVRAEADDSTEPIAPTPVEQNLPDDEKSTVYISADGKIMLDGEVVALDKFEKRYEAYLRKVGGGVFISFKANDNADIDLVNDVKDIIDKFVVIRIKPKSSELTSTVYISADGKITFNDEVVTLDELKAELEKLRAEKGTDAVLTIKADNATRLITIQGVKDVARQSGVLRVKYLAAENEVDKVLPPIPTAENGIKVVTDIRSMVAKHNLLMVFMNARGDIMTTRPDGKEAIVGLDELKSIVKQFVDNTESINHNRKKKNPNYSDFKWQTIKRGNGEVHYPVSEGVVSVQTTLDVDAEKYLALHSTIIQAYAELREELAQRSFKQSFESLGDDDRRYIMQAIPIKVSEVEPKKIKQASNANIPRPKDFFKDADAGDIPLGTYRPIGFDTKREWTKVDGETAEKISRGIPTFIFKSDTQLEVITPVEVDFVKTGLYSYSVNNGKLYLKGANEYTFPCQIRYCGTEFDLHIGVDAEMYGVKLKKIILIKSDK